MRYAAFLGLSGVLLTGCVTAPPEHPGDICSVFKEKRSWYHAAMKAQRKWAVPVSVPMAIMYQESGFHAALHTKRTYFLWIVPTGYVTSAYGYPQAKNATWRDFERRTGQSASRDDFHDALDFMSWYIVQSRRQFGIPVTDARRQYLAYHEGWGGYRVRSYIQKTWLLRIADQVSVRAQLYAQQLAACREDLQDHGFWSWLF